MDATTIWIAVVALTAIACNVLALVAGDKSRTPLHNAATWVGAIGLLLLVSIPITLLYVAFDYVANPLHSYSGSFLAAMAILGLAASIASLVLACVIAHQSRRRSA